MHMKKLIGIAVALAMTTAAVPAQAHGGFWPGFGIGVATGLVAPFFAPPIGYAPPLVYAPPTPPVWYYPPGAPTRWVAGPQTPDDQTRWVQASLNHLGYGPLIVDGIEGFATYQAISAFQANNSLVVDGICGPACSAVIAAQLPPPPPPPHQETNGK